MATVSHAAYDSKIEGNVIISKLDAGINWMRKNSLWPMPMGLACCAIEMMAAACARFDIARFGAKVMRFSPRQSDVMIVAGTVTYKMALAVKRIYDQMPEPKWAIAMGACASSGGMYRSYAVLESIYSCRWTFTLATVGFVGSPIAVPEPSFLSMLALGYTSLIGMCILRSRRPLR